jgi:hypothetical protein
MAKAATLSSGSVLLPDVGMSQSSLMVGALIAGFVVYLAMNGKLATYWSILIGGGSTSATTTTPSATTSTTSTTPSASTSTTTTPNVSTLPASLGSYLGGLGGTTASSTATGGTGTAANAGAAVGVPNTSLSTFYGLGG